MAAVLLPALRNQRSKAEEPLEQLLPAAVAAAQGPCRKAFTAFQTPHAS
jgi:hypothetical protein